VKISKLAGMAVPADADLDETTAVDAKYARRIDRGLAIGGFDFPDATPQLRRSAIAHQVPRNEDSSDKFDLKIHTPIPVIANGSSVTNAHPTLLTLAAEVRELIWRYTLNNLDNTPDEVACQHFDLSQTQGLSLIARQMLPPRLCFGLRSSVKAGKFPNVLLLNKQTYGEATQLLYAGRKLMFCTWNCFMGWMEKLLERGQAGAEALLRKVKEVIVDV
jgi:hypothetical protein